jgi:hypothetical protein
MRGDNVLLQQLLNGITQGSIYALMAIGFSVVLGIVGLVTFVHGEVIMIGAFAGFFAITFFRAYVIMALLAGFAASWVLGFVIERIAYRPFRKSPEHIALICTIGMSIIIKNLGQKVFGTETQLVPDVFGDKFFLLGSLRVTFLQAAVLGIVVLMCVLLQQLLLGGDHQTDFRSRRDQQHVGMAICCFRKDIGTLAQPISSGILRAVQSRHMLSRQNQRDRVLTCFDSHAPGDGGFIGISGTDDGQTWDSTEIGQLLNRLVGRPILPQSDAVMRKDVDDM